MNLRRRLALRYLAIVSVCLLLLAGLAYHEFVTEPRVRRELGLPKPSGSTWGEYAEIVFHALIPLVLGAGWWLMRRTLVPLDTLTQQVERLHAGNLGSPLPRTHTGDEVDRLTEAFNHLRLRVDQAFRQIRDFTLDASHELKTPLSLMRLQLESALAEPAGPGGPQREWIHQHLEEVQRLTKIVDSLTLLTKADAGLVVLDRQPLALDELVRESFEDGQILGQTQQLQLRLARCDAVVVPGDRGRLRQMLLNLMDNAVKYNRLGGAIEVSLVEQSPFAELVIRNTGDGIPAELIPRLFDRFVRGSDALSNAVEGSGLGLAIVRWIVEAHDGTVAITSQPGQSTWVIVRLPLAERVTKPASF